MLVTSRSRLWAFLKTPRWVRRPSRTAVPVSQISSKLRWIPFRAVWCCKEWSMNKVVSLLFGWNVWVKSSSLAACSWSLCILLCCNKWIAFCRKYAVFLQSKVNIKKMENLLVTLICLALIDQPWDVPLSFWQEAPCWQECQVFECCCREVKKNKPAIPLMTRM